MRVLDLVRIADAGGAPAPLVDVDAAKAQLQVEHDDHNAVIAGLIEAVLAHVEGYAGILGRATVRQTWRLRLPRFPSGRALPLPLPPLISVTSIAYRDSFGATQTLTENTHYHVLDGPLARVELVSGESWPVTETHPRAVTVTFVCGYGEAADVPAGIRQAVLLMVADLYKNRESGVEGAASVERAMSTAVMNLLRPHMTPRV